MSYILDALRRAEAERGRGAVPGLHTPAATVPGGMAPPVGSRAPASLALIALAVVTAAGLAAGATWWFLQRPGGERVVVAAQPLAAPSTSAAPAPAEAAAPFPVSTPASDPAPAPAPTVSPAPAQVATVPVQPAPSTASAAPRPVDKRAASVVPPRERPATSVASPSAPRAAAATAAPTRPRGEPSAAPAPATPTEMPPPASPVFAQGDLPDSVRAQLPTLKVTGATHSNNPAYRMAIVNGQVLQEGDQAAPGLRLESIEAGRTVWSFRGYRYAVPAQQ